MCLAFFPLSFCLYFTHMHLFFMGRPVFHTHIPMSFTCTPLFFICTPLFLMSKHLFSHAWTWFSCAYPIFIHLSLFSLVYTHIFHPLVPVFDMHTLVFLEQAPGHLLDQEHKLIWIYSSFISFIISFYACSVLSKSSFDL